MRALLHVEDEDAMAFVFCAAVREGNIQATVNRVSDGAEALAYLRRLEPHIAAVRPDLVFLDLSMPKVDGWQVLLEIKNEESLQSIPVVVLSTAFHNAEKERAYALGAKHFITKAFHYEAGHLHSASCRSNSCDSRSSRMIAASRADRS